MRKIIDYNPYESYKKTDMPVWDNGEQWPCKWICIEMNVEKAFAAAYRCFFTVSRQESIRVHVSADEKYELFLDGISIGRGSERGNKNNWFFDTYDLELEAGEHIIVMKVWSMGKIRSYYQDSVYHGFILCPEQLEYINVIGTGNAKWEGKKIAGCDFHKPEGSNTGADPRLRIDGFKFPWDYECGLREGWLPVYSKHSGNNKAGLDGWRDEEHVMRPALLPVIESKKITTAKVIHVEELSDEDATGIKVQKDNNIDEEMVLWQNLFDNKPVTVKPNTSIRIIIDLCDYYCAHTSIITSKGRGAEIKHSWTEALIQYKSTTFTTKGNRDGIYEKYFDGMQDIYITDGGDRRRFDSIFLKSGRYIEIQIHTKDDALQILAYEMMESRYPIEMQGQFETSDTGLNKIVPLCFRTLQMCMQDMYVDCPHWELNSWVGDSRIQGLLNYVCSTDRSLAKKSIEMFEQTRCGRLNMVTALFPKGGIIPSFSLWWIAMVYDYALWNDDTEFVKMFAPAMRQILDQYLRGMNEEGLIKTPLGWNFYDWGFDLGKVSFNEIKGEPPNGKTGYSGTFHWHIIYILGLMVKLEELINEPELAIRWAKKIKCIKEGTDKFFWNERRGMYADDIENTSFSEQTQSLAVISGSVESCKLQQICDALMKDKNIIRADIFFRHYLYEAYDVLGKREMIINDLERWTEFIHRGLKTVPEFFGDINRSDCHAWGAHPLYHFFTKILGVYPACLGFKHVVITPFLGMLTYAKGKMPHAKGEIKLEFY